MASTLTFIRLNSLVLFDKRHPNSIKVDNLGNIFYLFFLCVLNEWLNLVYTLINRAWCDIAANSSTPSLCYLTHTLATGGTPQDILIQIHPKALIFPESGIDTYHIMSTALTL